mgnify:FL=1
MTGDWQAEFDRIVGDAAREAFRLLCQQQAGGAYLYYTPGGVEWGRLVPVTDGGHPPAGAVLVDAQRIPGDRAVQGIRAWIDERARRLPILPTKGL